MQAILPVPPPHHALPYFNCGAFMGKAGAVRRMFNDIRQDIALNFEPSAARPKPKPKPEAKAKARARATPRAGAGAGAASPPGQEEIHKREADEEELTSTTR
jgi:hypothetical protein